MSTKDQEIEEMKTAEQINAPTQKKQPSPFKLLVIVLIVLVILVGVGLSAYYYAGAVDTTVQDTSSAEAPKTTEEKELESIGSDLNDINKDLDTTTLDADASEIEKLDLSGV